MDRLRTFAVRLAGLFRKRQLEEELDEELGFHLDREIEENRTRGMSPEEARRSALRSFGGLEQVKENYRDQRTLPRFEALIQDIRFAARLLIRNPGFSAVAVLSLMLGIGANTAIFSVLNTLVFKPFPYPESNQLVVVRERTNLGGRSGWSSVSPPNLADFRAESTVFDEIGGYQMGGVNLTGADRPVRVGAALVEPDVFRALRIEPLLGRYLSPGEDQAGRDRVAVLSHGLWESRFGAKPDIVGSKVGVNGAEHVVIGVMPPSFQFPPRTGAEVWIPLTLPQEAKQGRGYKILSVIARLNSETSIWSAGGNMNALARRLQERYPEAWAQRGVLLRSFHGEMVGPAANVLLVLTGAVMLVLLLACANVANMTLARTTRRRRELAVRLTMGAGRFRIARLMMVEALILAAVGGILGLAAARWSLDALRYYAEASLALPEVHLDGTVLWYCCLVSMVAAMMVAILPAWHLGRINLQTALKDGDPSFGRALGRNRSILVVAEIALALVLVVGAVLMLTSLHRLARFDLGFDPERVLSMRLVLPQEHYSTPRVSSAFYDQFLEKVRALPGVISAGMVSNLPIQSFNSGMSIAIEGMEPPPPGLEMYAEHRLISAGYFQTMGIQLVAGRYPTKEDMNPGQKILFINQQLAARSWPNENPIGRRIAGGTARDVPEDRWLTVSGVVRNYRSGGVYRSVPNVMYVPYSHFSYLPAVNSMSLVLRTAVEPTTVTGAVRGVLSELDPDQPVFRIKTMEQVVEDSVAGTRLLMRLLTIFGLLALLLAVVGVYGVMSYFVSQRVHEIGIRMALGAGSGSIVRLMLRHCMLQALTGSLVGILAALALSRIIGRFVIGIESTDLATYAVATAAVVAVALSAGFIPARRASKVDPLSALRQE